MITQTNINRSILKFGFRKIVWTYILSSIMKQDRIAGSALSAPESVQFCHITRFCYDNSEQILTDRFETLDLGRTYGNTYMYQV